MGDEERARKPANELSHKATVGEMKDLADEIRRVAGKDEITPEDETYLEEMREDFEDLDAHRKSLERAALVARVDVATGKSLHSERGHTPKDLDDDPFGEPRSIDDGGTFSNPWNLEEMRTWNRGPEEVGSELRARALSAVEKVSGANADRKAAMSKILEEFDTADGKIAKMALYTSHPDYVRGFNKLARNPNQAVLSPAEQAAVNRAMSLTDSAGGYLIPFQLDPVVLNISDGSVNQIRQVARQVVATGDVWSGLTGTEVSWSTDAEGAEVSDDTPTFGQPQITIYTHRGFVPITMEALQDERNVAQEVGNLLSDGKDTYEASMLATGSGSGPQGIVTALSAYATSHVIAGTTSAFALSDLYSLEADLPAKYRARGSFLANHSIYNLIRQFDTSGGAALWARLGDGTPARLLDRPAYESEDMDGTLSTADDYVLVFGEFAKYVVADRVGTTIEFIPHLFSTTTNRPSGTRGWFASYRMGADSINDDAFSILVVQ